MELVCPAGNLPALKRAVDEGADAVYFGFPNATNARQFAGLNFSNRRARDGIAYARARGKRVFCAINTYPPPDGWAQWASALGSVASWGWRWACIRRAPTPSA
ncbi:collagenase-like PrtC family protease [Halomonas stenophila]|uniref:Collagenase-like PrtC family protease n=1 Tax=Halomonas stenophila TaxID=795312 RepID=A0A7W5ESM5_9GAMM|nr:collagenase-like PrtC family protease [Halomonas stenophila]